MSRRISYSEHVVTFDIETTSYKDDDVKKAIVYTYTLSVDGEITTYRTRDQFMDALEFLVWLFRITPEHRLVVYVHNLAFEYRFIKHYFEWLDVFAVSDANRITRATTKTGIEFRCSYMLTHLPLSSVGKEVGVKKMTGDLDYGLMRHGSTPITDEEQGYIDNDVAIIDALLSKRLKDDTFKSIPMTSTGYVRRKVRQSCRKDPDYMAWLRSTPLTKPTYELARTAFSGGYVHANANFFGEVVEDVTAFDLGSSYPSSMVQFRFPLTMFTPAPVADDPAFLDQKAMTDCFMVDVTLHDITTNYPFPTISSSKALSSSDVTEDNGRVFSASSVRLVLTDVEWTTIRRCYSVDSIFVHEFVTAGSGVLPSPIIDPIIELYTNKTTLKGVSGYEDLYLASKAQLNSVYGMSAMDPVRQDITFDVDTQEMIVKPADIDEQLAAHNKSKSRFLYYPWAAWVTAYSRSILLNTIYDLMDAGVDVIYCDTDSIYYRTDPRAVPVFDAINREITERIEQAELIRGHSGRTAPAKPDGTPTPLGVFEFDGHYSEFKTLGAKRYAVVTDDGDFHFHITVSGLSKNAAGYIVDHGGMNFFRDGMTIPAEFSGRNTHTYSDETVTNMMTDYLGNTELVEQTGFVHLESAPYHLSVSDAYTNFVDSLIVDFIH